MSAPQNTLEYDSLELIARIKRYVEQGFGFIPLVGSGMSAPSGILMGQTFTNFLSYTMYLVLCPPDERKVERFLLSESQWNIRKDGWPNYPTKTEMDIVRKWLLKRFLKICERRGFEAKAIDGTIVDISPAFSADARHLSSVELVAAVSRPFVPLLIRNEHYSATEDLAKRLIKTLNARNESDHLTGPVGFSPTSQDYVVEEGVTSLHDWRATLAFLSRVDLERGKDERSHRLVLRERDTSVIDGFNIHITRDKRHNLGHKMLTHLARPMRIRTILTTNFDNLIEEAFRNVSKPLTVLPVSIKGGLPDPKTVRAQNSIIKLHGELLETRADFSLDVDPLPEDKQRFAQYFLGPGPGADQKQPGKSVIPSHLLVMGYSGSDLRCIQLIKHLLDSDPAIRIFWICFSKWDVEKVSSIFSEDSYRSRILIHKTTRPDLLLYELYQNLALCLPGGGFAYEFTHKVPPRRYTRVKRIDDKICNDLCKGIEADVDVYSLARDWCANETDVEFAAKMHLRRAVSRSLASVVTDSVLTGKARQLSPGLGHYATFDTFPRKTGADTDRPANSFAIDLCSGASSALNIAFQELANDHGKNCIWLELQDYITPETLIHDILRVISLRIGRYQLEHLTLFPMSSVPPDRDDLDSQTEAEAKKEREQKQELVRHFSLLLEYFNEIPEQWVLFLYGRNGPGASSGWENTIWNEEQFRKLTSLIEILAEVGIKVVYAPLTNERIGREKQKAESIAGSENGAAGTKLARVCHYFGLGLEPDPEKPDFEHFFTIARNINEDGRSPYITDSRFPQDELPEYVATAWQPRYGNPAGRREISLFDNIIDRLLEKWILVPGYDDGEREEQMEIRAKFKFLFAITLFRQSRHTSAFFSDAVYSCPFRYNLVGIDNDWTRAETVRKWISELRELGIFYYKPGGYCWKHRDIRLSIQLLLQNLPLFRCDDYQREDHSFRFRPAFLLESRARAHYWIADWYFKAFATTGHSTPAIEALYHGFKCAEYSCLARPSSLDYSDPDQMQAIVAYRFLLFRSAVTNMTKVLKIGHRWLKFWLSGSSIHPMLDEQFVFSSGQSLEAVLLEIVDDKLVPSLPGKGTFRKADEEIIEEEKRKSREIVRTFIDARNRLGHAVAGEGGTHPGKIRGLGELPSFSDTGIVPERITETDQSNRREIVVSFSPYVVGRPANSTEETWKSQFDEWFNSQTFLDCKKLTTALDNLDASSDPGQPGPIALRQRLNADLKRWRGEWCQKHASSGGKTFMLVKLLSEFAYLYVKRAKMEFHAKVENPWGRAHNPGRWLQATALCFSGLDLAKHLHPAFTADEISEKCKLHSLYAISLANLDRFFEAHRHLNEAIALLSKASTPMDSINLGIIRLRRSEVYLTEALRVGQILELELSPELLEKPSNQGILDRLRHVLMKIERRARKGKKTKKLQKKFSQIMDWRPYGGAAAAAAAGLPTPPFSETVNTIVDEKKVFGGSSGGNSGESSQARICIHPVIAQLYQAFDADRPQNLDLREQLVKSIDRFHTACLDDAYNELEMARLLLSGKSQSSLWWSKIILLNLRIYGAQHKQSGFESLAFGRRIEHGAKAINLLRRGLLISQHDPYIGLKTIDYFLKAWIVVSDHERNKGQWLKSETRLLIHDTIERYKRVMLDKGIAAEGDFDDHGDPPEQEEESLSGLHLLVRYHQHVARKFRQVMGEPGPN